MKKKLENIVLIDDNPADNFYHTIIIEDCGCSKRITAFESGVEALEYLRSMENGAHPHPDLIFLDINMPVMTGWEFLEEYNKLDKGMKAKMVVVMLTTSANPDDKQKADNHSDIPQFTNKPLSEELLKEIIENNFN